MKQRAGVESTQENINSLIGAVQNAANGLDRSKVLLRLWKTVGNTIMDQMAGKSYRINSDFDMRGFSLKERQRNLAGDAYLVFFMATMDFDRGLGVPFMAYISQKLGWKLAADKRDNTKRDDRIKISSKMHEYVSDDITEEDAFAALLERTPNEEDVEGDCFRRDAILKIKNIAASAPKIAAYLEACQEVCNQGFRGSDAEVARFMGCTRASTGNYRKKLVRMLSEKGMDFNSLVATAA
ncbi:hypothetical protein [uncultured Fibrobacter sp.]|uniref:hypothetical protein n=1 Tax=uncultured Fibrobacter sp. TaxID=261512 RepID=UPI0025D5EE8A|nr:hypothetical protein [uncultured Fibrobacter sp.]